MIIGISCINQQPFTTETYISQNNLPVLAETSMLAFNTDTLEVHTRGFGYQFGNPTLGSDYRKLLYEEGNGETHHYTVLGYGIGTRFGGNDTQFLAAYNFSDCHWHYLDNSLSVVPDDNVSLIRVAMTLTYKRWNALREVFIGSEKGSQRFVARFSSDGSNDIQVIGVPANHSLADSVDIKKAIQIIGPGSSLRVTQLDSAVDGLSKEVQSLADDMHILSSDVASAFVSR